MTEPSPIAGDLSRECFCTCHIPMAKLSTNPAFGVTVRIECTQRSWVADQTGLLCKNCGRSGKARYEPIEETKAIELGKAALHSRYASPEPVEKALVGMRTTIETHFKEDEERESLRKKALDELEKGLLEPVGQLLDLWLSDGHVAADFENWIKLARAFGKEQDAREIADSYDPEGKWLEREV